MKHYLSIGAFLIVLFLTGLPALSQTAANQTSLNGNWNFKTDPANAGLKEAWFAAASSYKNWDKMSVPGNWDTRNEYNDYVGVGWYQRDFDLPQASAEKSIYLRFDGVYFNSRVWLNGVLLGTNNNGFLPFEFDISKLARPTGNSLVVMADNTFRLGAVWNWGGIRRAINLVIADPVRAVSQHISPDVDLASRRATVSVKISLSNNSTKDERIKGSVRIHNGATSIRTIPFIADLPAGLSKQVTVSTELRPSEVHLWHFDDPHLYTSSVLINRADQPVHQLSDRFGIRKVEIDHKRYEFRLNGEPVRLMGLNLVAEDRTTGNTLPLWRIKEDIDMMKELGSNMTRITHFPLPKEMYDYLDERGMMVFPEVSLWGFNEMVDPSHPLPRQWLERMVNEQYNHPSVIGWSVGNEIGWNPLALEYSRSAIAHAKELDPSRLAVVVSHTAHDSVDIIKYSDLGMINKYARNLGPVTRRQHANHPDKLLFYSEFGDVQSSEDPDTRLNLENAIDSLRFKPYLMGASIWTFNDYRSAYKGTKELSGNRPWGVVDVFRQKKRSWRTLKNANAPVESLNVRTENAGNSTIAYAEISPRSVLDIPAFKLKNYRLAWHLRDSSGTVVGGGFRPLPDINPSDKAFQIRFSWKSVPNVHALEVNMINPLGYSVADTTLFYKKPLQPVITGIQGHRASLQPGQERSGAIRVHFNIDAFGSEYKLKYGPGLSQETVTTINPFIDLSGLPPGGTYNTALVAVNSAGESEPAYLKTQSIDFIPAQPVIRYVEAADSGFFIGYSNLINDYLMEIQVTTTKGNYEAAKIFTSRTKGVSSVRGLVNGQEYFFRARRIDEDMVPGAWSDEMQVRPDGNQIPAPPGLEAIFKNGPQALVTFQPVKKAIGYRLRYRQSNTTEWEYTDISSAAAKYFILTGLKRSAYEFGLASLNQYGMSDFSSSRFFSQE